MKNEKENPFDKINAMAEDIKALKGAILGTEYSPRGIMIRLEAVEDYQERDKKLKWMVAGGSFVVGFLIKWLGSKVFEIFTDHKAQLIINKMKLFAAQIFT